MASADRVDAGVTLYTHSDRRRCASLRWRKTEATYKRWPSRRSFLATRTHSNRWSGTTELLRLRAFTDGVDEEDPAVWSLATAAWVGVKARGEVDADADVGGIIRQKKKM